MNPPSSFKRYRYLGSEGVDSSLPSFIVTSAADLQRWLHQQDEWEGDTLTVTFVVTTEGALAVAPRRSEHVVCAGGQAVLAAGELTLRSSRTLEVVSASNQSTGYCPEAGCWSAVLGALRALNIPAPDELSVALDFRRCEACHEINLIKEGWFFCAACGDALPARWNL